MVLFCNFITAPNCHHKLLSYLKLKDNRKVAKATMVVDLELTKSSAPSLTAVPISTATSGMIVVRGVRELITGIS